jgi:hypothetical protein
VISNSPTRKRTGYMAVQSAEWDSLQIIDCEM